MTVNRSAIVTQGAAAIGLAAAKIVRIKVGTICRTSLRTEPAMAAGHEGKDHMVARAHFDDMRPYSSTTPAPSCPSTIGCGTG